MCLSMHVYKEREKVRMHTHTCTQDPKKTESKYISFSCSHNKLLNGLNLEEMYKFPEIYKLTTTESWRNRKSEQTDY